MDPVVFGLVALLFGAFGGFGLGTWQVVGRARRAANQIEETARAEARALREETYRLVEGERQAALEDLRRRTEVERDQLMKDLRQLESDLRQLEERLRAREELLDRKALMLEQREENLVQARSRVGAREEALDDRSRLLDDEQARVDRALEELAGMTRQQARERLLARAEADIRQDTALLLKRIVAEAEERAEEKARKVIATAIQRYAADQVADATVTVVTLPSDDMKGRIIGRHGRNIRALEMETGVNFVIDDTPEAVTVSCFDPVRREVAARALRRLVSDGRIHPAHIEDVVAKVRTEVEAEVRKVGEEACIEVGLQRVDPRLVTALGRLHYRTSYGQNVLRHCIEVAQICRMMAAELGLDETIALRAALFHDVGKAQDQTHSGDHAAISADLAERCGEPPEVVLAIATHHDRAPRSVYGVLVQAADALSAARPGARRESLETYVRRLRKLEQLALEFDGVAQAHAIHAGRELRVIVEPTAMSDEEMLLLSRNLARRIERELQYPGEIKVTAIREMRAVEFAR